MTRTIFRWVVVFVMVMLTNMLLMSYGIRMLNSVGEFVITLMCWLFLAFALAIFDVARGRTP